MDTIREVFFSGYPADLAVLGLALLAAAAAYYHGYNRE